MTCDSESCASDLLSYQEVSVNNSNNLIIDSTLTINTEQLELNSQIFNVECRVEQIIPEALNLQGENTTFFTNLRVQFEGQCHY